jgi:hypothetical protein
VPLRPKGGEVEKATMSRSSRRQWPRSIPRTSSAGRKCQPSCGRSLRVSVQTGQSGGGAKYFCQWPQLEQAYGFSGMAGRSGTRGRGGA